MPTGTVVVTSNRQTRGGRELGPVTKLKEELISQEPGSTVQGPLAAGSLSDRHPSWRVPFPKAFDWLAL